MSVPRYGSPQALRRAVADRLRELAGQRSGARLSDLLRQFSYDRLLAYGAPRRGARRRGRTDRAGALSASSPWGAGDGR